MKCTMTSACFVMPHALVTRVKLSTQRKTKYARHSALTPFLFGIIESRKDLTIMSIRTRLTIFYTALLALILLLFSAGVYGAVSYIIRGQVDDNLKRASDTLINSLLITASGRDVVVPQLNVIGLVVDTDGNIINRSNNLDKAVTKPFTGIDFAKLNALPADQLQETYYANAVHNGMNMRVLTRPIVGEKQPRHVFFYLRKTGKPCKKVRLMADQRSLFHSSIWKTIHDRQFVDRGSGAVLGRAAEAASFLSSRDRARSSWTSIYGTST